MDDLTDNERKFLEGLEKLTRETGIGVEGCGCCGSPYLTEIPKDHQQQEAGYAYGKLLCWTHPEDFYWGESPVVSHQGEGNE